MGAVVRFATGRWPMKKSRKSGGASITPVLMSVAWLKKNGPFTARVTAQDGLILCHEKADSLPLQVWHDLRKAFIAYYVVKDGIPIELVGTRQSVAAWLKGGRQAETLDCNDPSPGRHVPHAANSAAIHLAIPYGNGHYTEMLCALRLIRQ